MSLGKKFLTFAAVIGTLVVGGGFASADTSDTQTIDYQIDAFRYLALSASSVTFSTVQQGGATSADGGSVIYASGDSGDLIEIGLDADISGGEFVGAYVVGTIAPPTAAACTASGTPAKSQAASGTATTSAVSLVAASTAPVTFISGISGCGETNDYATASIGYVLDASGAATRASSATAYTATYTIKASS